MSPPEGTVFVHVGYHKTGTTYLQERVFNNPSFRFQSYPREELCKYLVDVHPLTFSVPRARAHFDDWIARTRDLGMVPVLTHERLSGYPASGGFDSKELADRLVAVLPSAKILI